MAVPSDDMNEPSKLKAIPSVDLVLRHVEEQGLLRTIPRPMAARAVRALLRRERERMLASPDEAADGEALRAGILRAAEDAVVRAGRVGLVPVVNATGIIVHTNLGRAPLAEDAVAAIQAAAAYSNLEYDLSTGQRGSRGLLVRDALLEISGAEGALVTNNNAAAVLLALNTLAEGREVVISRGELIEIGGSFRLPEVFERSGSRMVAVGTTNRTRLSDYEGAISNRTAAIMTAHWSNYEIVGFVERVDVGDLAALGRRCGVPVIHDLGSGIALDPARIGLAGEMTIAESVRAGVSVATVSGDKLLGGPQAGIAVGERDVIERMGRNPLLRALRPCKLTLAALEATLEHHVRGRATSEVPVLRMIAAPIEGLRERASRLAEALNVRWPSLASAEVVDLVSHVGGGAAPERGIASVGIAVASRSLSAGELASRLRGADTPVIARTKDDRVLLDLRTVAAHQDDLILAAVDGALGDAT